MRQNLKAFFFSCLFLPTMYFAQPPLEFLGVPIEWKADSHVVHSHWLDHLLELPSIHDSLPWIDIRMYEQALGRGEGYMIRLHSIADDSMEASFYSYAFESSDKFYEEIRHLPDSSPEYLPREVSLKTTTPNLQIGTWKELWEYLISRQMFQLKPHAMIRDSINHSLEQSVTHAIQNKVDDFPLDNYDKRADIVVLDGSGWYVLVKVGLHARTYSYNNPGRYQEIYPEIPEFRHFSQMITKLKEVFKIERL